MSAFLRMFDLASHAAANAPTIAIKDSIDVAGYPTTAASRALADASPATRHAEVVQRLLDAGWRITGKANMHELAFGMTGINDFSGTPVNPQDPARIPGGSSSGSASAVGSKLVDAALGTDTGGSVRCPAACCGVIGLKPTFGRVSREGVAPRQTTLDCVGPFARNMDTIIDVMLAIDASFQGGRSRRDVTGLRVALPEVESDGEIRDAVTAAVARSGLASRVVQLESLPDAFAAGLAVINAETWHAFGHLVGGGQLGPDITARLKAAANTRASELVAAERIRRVFTDQVDRVLEDSDVLILPTLPSLPITTEAARAGTSVIAMSSLIRPFNLSGHPALTLPVPIDRMSLKAGLQIVGRRGDDETVCAVAAYIEAMLACNAD
ncbi:amidase family protein [Burkholderia cenocepacia]|uniref:amidase n=1 Tax=Burkholderia TaxID=32008 RepID=UPI0004F7CD0A|nr:MULTISPECIES: amidase [Burkholderia]AIO37966.1 amidase family protein [Burkholderia cenocepacia]AOK06435.1 glutamyl-tRNA amidotransferase [Burkholderia latens]MCA8310447.1 amidase [Burkholderia sp. AU28942]QTO52277.1 amidase [Burkholderia latens]